MREIGVRELKRSLSETLRSVARGEQVRVTVRGRPVADIVPAGAMTGDDVLRRLVAEARVTPADSPRPPRPPQLVKGRGSASAIVVADRDAER